MTHVALAGVWLWCVWLVFFFKRSTLYFIDFWGLVSAVFSFFRGVLCVLFSEVWCVCSVFMFVCGVCVCGVLRCGVCVCGVLRCGVCVGVCGVVCVCGVLGCGVCVVL